MLKHSENALVLRRVPSGRERESLAPEQQQLIIINHAGAVPQTGSSATEPERSSSGGCYETSHKTMLPSFKAAGAFEMPSEAISTLIFFCLF